MRLQARRVCEKDESDGLGDLFGERIVEDKRVVPALVDRHIVCSLRDGVGLTLANPLDSLESNRRQLLDDRGLRIAGAGVRGCSGQVLVGIGTVRSGGR